MESQNFETSKFNELKEDQTNSLHHFSMLSSILNLHHLVV